MHVVTLVGLNGLGLRCIEIKGRSSLQYDGLLYCAKCMNLE